MNDLELIGLLIDRVAGLVRSDARRAGAKYQLQPVQLEVLDYIRRANRYSDTATAVTEYLGLTKGTVSQTLKVLLSRGYIIKRIDSDDKRVSRLKVTPAGLKALRSCRPSPLLKKAGKLLEGDELDATVERLSDLLQVLQETNNDRSFGQCAGCVHNMGKRGDRWCGLTREPLSDPETELICREFTAREQWHPIGKH